MHFSRQFRKIQALVFQALENEPFFFQALFKDFYKRACVIFTNRLKFGASTFIGVIEWTGILCLI
jgi:hypothetical protein